MLILEILRSEFEKRKEKNNRYSLRAYAAHLGISISLLSEWFSGKRLPSLKSFYKIEPSISLNSEDKQSIVCELEQFEKTKSERKSERRYRLNADQHKIISRWEVPAILSLANIENNKHCPEWIGSQLGIASKEAAILFSLLESNNYIKKEGLGFKANQKGVFAESKIPEKSIRQFHGQILDLAQSSIESCSMNERYLMGLTIPSSSEGIKEIQLEIKKMCNRVSRIAEKYNDDPRVYQLAVQYFPLSRSNR